MKCCPIKADGSRLDVPGGIYLFSCIISALSLCPSAVDGFEPRDSAC